MKKRYLILPMVALLLTSNVYAITSNDVTYDNDGTTENLTTTLDNLYSELKKYKTGGSVAANQMLEGATGYSKGELVTGTIKSKAAQTYTPGTSNQTIDAGVYLSGAQTIKGDANLTAANIAAGKSIFGVSGTYTSDANATAANILSGKTAYVNGSKVTGTIASKAATTYTPGTSNQTINAGQYLSGAQTIKGDANLTAANIAKGKSIFGVSGTYTSDANATAAAILSGYTAYVNGSKVTGTMVDRSSNTGTAGLSSATGKMELDGAWYLRVGINPGFYGTSNYSSFGTPAIHTPLFTAAYAMATTVGTSANCTADVPITETLPAGSYVFTISVSRPGANVYNSYGDDLPLACGNRPCSGFSSALFTRVPDGYKSVSVFYAKLEKSFSSGSKILRVASETCSEVGPFSVSMLWMKIGS